MDQKGADYYIINQTANQTHNFYLKKTLQFLLPISIISFLVSYFSIFSLVFHSLEALDRKCMFLLCNGILAFLAKSLTSPLSHGEKNFDDEDALFFRENEAYVEYVDHTSSEIAAVPEEIEIKVQDDGVSQNAAEEIETETVSTEEWEGDEDEDDDHDDEKEVQDSPSVMTDMRVSTEELNKKFDEFIRKMKEEIRIEARQQYLIAV